MNAFRAFLEAARPQIDSALDRVLPPTGTAPARLHEAMRYAVFAGGKRFRPALLLATAQRLGANTADLLEAASALELIHTFSLVHDDLPALDDDDLRRGRATVHIEYDEALAVLVGDALLGLGLEVLSVYPQSQSAEVRAKSVTEVARALGSTGMIGGQVDDLAAEGQPAAAYTAELLESIHRRKTGALLVVSMVMAGSYAGRDEEDGRNLRLLGDRLGLVFQMVDDILDIEGDAESLGKTAGKDVLADKLTYPRLYGMDRTRQMLSETRTEALDLSASLPGEPSLHNALIEFLVQRRH